MLNMIIAALYSTVIFSELEVKENIEGYTFYKMYVLPKNE